MKEFKEMNESEKNNISKEIDKITIKKLKEFLNKKEGEE